MRASTLGRSKCEIVTAVSAGLAADQPERIALYQTLLSLYSHATTVHHWGEGPMGGPASTVAYQSIAGTLQAFREAVALHDRGRLGEAEQRYETVLRVDARHFQAIYRLGLIRMQQGRFGDAVSLFRRAVKVERRSAHAYL